MEIDMRNVVCKEKKMKQVPRENQNENMHRREEEGGRQGGR